MQYGIWTFLELQQLKMEYQIIMKTESAEQQSLELLYNGCVLRTLVHYCIGTLIICVFNR
jgi:hypothetical protein